MGFDITELVASLGAYHRKHAPELYSKFLQKEYSQKLFKTISGVKDEYVADEFLLTEVLQPYQKTWTPKGDAAFSPEIIKARRIKIDMEFDPVDLERTWEGERIDGSLPEGQQLLESYIFDQILARAKKEIEYKITYKGVYKTPAAGVAGLAQDAADGLLKMVATAVTATKIVPKPTGAITPSNARESFELVFDSIDPDYQDEDLICLASPQLIRMYQRDYRTEFGANQDYTGMKKDGTGGLYIDGTGCELIPVAGMNGTSMIIITPRENLIRVIDGTEEDSSLNLRFQLDKRIIDVLGDFKMGWGFAIIEGLVWVNDPLTAPTVMTSEEQPQPPSDDSDKIKESIAKKHVDLDPAERDKLDVLKEELWGTDSDLLNRTTPEGSVEFPGTTAPANLDPVPPEALKSKVKKPSSRKPKNGGTVLPDEAPQAETPQAETPQSETSQGEVSQSEASQGETPQGETPIE